MRHPPPWLLAALFGFGGYPGPVSAQAAAPDADSVVARRLGSEEIRALFSGKRVADRAGRIGFDFRNDGKARILLPSPFTADGNGLPRVGAPRWLVRHDEICIVGRTQSSELCHRVLQAGDQVSMQVVSTSGAERLPFQVSIEAIPCR